MEWDLTERAAGRRHCGELRWNGCQSQREQGHLKAWEMEFKSPLFGLTASLLRSRIAIKGIESRVLGGELW